MAVSDLPPLRQLEYEEVVEYLTAKKITPVCPSCGEQQHYIERGTGNHDVGYFAQRAATVVEGVGVNYDRGGALVTVILSCINCGYQRHYNVSRMLTYFLNKEKA